MVANYVVRQRDFDRFASEIHTKDQYVVTLAPRLEVAQSQRGDRVLTEWEVQRMQYYYDRGIASPRFGYSIDTSDMNISQVVDEIVSLIHTTRTV